MAFLALLIDEGMWEMKSTRLRLARGSLARFHSVSDGAHPPVVSGRRNQYRRRGKHYKKGPGNGPQIL